jgi:hypothetical protein
MYRRPVSVTIVAWVIIILAGFSCLATFGQMLLSNDPQLDMKMGKNPLPYSVEIPLSATSAILGLVSGINMLQRANWARWLYVAMCIGLTIFDIFACPQITGMLAPLAFHGVMILFLFLPAANEYFSSDRGW